MSFCLDNKGWRSLSVEVGKYGRIVLPKKLREEYGVKDGTRLIIESLEDRIVLLPVRDYERPTDALYGSISLHEPLDEPKEVAREHIQRMLAEDLE